MKPAVLSAKSAQWDFLLLLECKEGAPWIQDIDAFVHFKRGARLRMIVRSRRFIGQGFSSSDDLTAKTSFFTTAFGYLKK